MNRRECLASSTALLGVGLGLGSHEQDRAFDEADESLHLNRGPSLRQGFRAGEILVNGVVRPNSFMPKGLSKATTIKRLQRPRLYV